MVIRVDALPIRRGTTRLALISLASLCSFGLAGCGGGSSTPANSTQSANIGNTTPSGDATAATNPTMGMANQVPGAGGHGGTDPAAAMMANNPMGATPMGGSPMGATPMGGSPMGATPMALGTTSPALSTGTGATSPMATALSTPGASGHGAAVPMSTPMGGVGTPMGTAIPTAGSPALAATGHGATPPTGSPMATAIGGTATPGATTPGTATPGATTPGSATPGATTPMALAGGTIPMANAGAAAGSPMAGSPMPMAGSPMPMAQAGVAIGGENPMPGAAGGQAGQAPQPGTPEFAAYEFSLAINKGEFGKLEPLISGKAVGVLKDLRSNTLGSAKQDELKQEFGAPVLTNSKTVAGGKQFTLRSGLFVISITVKKEGDTFKVTELSRTKSRR